MQTYSGDPSVLPPLEVYLDGEQKKTGLYANSMLVIRDQATAVLTLNMTEPVVRLFSVQMRVDAFDGTISIEAFDSRGQVITGYNGAEVGVSSSCLKSLAMLPLKSVFSIVYIDVHVRVCMS